MSYTRVNWQDAPSVSTPLSASNLNKMDAGIKQNADDIEALQQHTYDSALDDTSTNAPQTKVVKKAIEDAVESVTIITDPTLSNEGQAADAKATGEAVAQVKSAIGLRTITYTDGAYINVGTSTAAIGNPTVNSGYKYAVIPCQGGDTFTVSGTGTSNARVWAFVRSDNSIISKAGSSDVPANLIITAPANTAYLVLNSRTKTSVSFYGKFINEELKDTNSRFSGVREAIAKTSGNIIAEFLPGFFNIVAAGSTASITRTLTDGAVACAILEVEPSDIIHFSVNGGGTSSAGARAFAFLDENYTVLSRSAQNAVYKDITTNVPENAKYMLLNHILSDAQFEPYAYLKPYDREKIAAIDSVTNALNHKLNFVSYDNEQIYVLRKIASANDSTQIGVSRFGEAFVFDGTNNTSNDIRVKANGAVGRLGNASGVANWTNGIELKTGHLYEARVRKIGGVANDSSILGIGFVVYKEGTYVNIVNPSVTTDGILIARFVAEANVKYHFAFFISVGNTYNNAVYILTLEDTYNDFRYVSKTANIYDNTLTGTLPQGAVVVDDYAYIYFSNYGGGAYGILKIDFKTGTETFYQMNLGHGNGMTYYNGKLYVCGMDENGRIYIVDADTMSLDGYVDFQLGGDYATGNSAIAYDPTNNQFVIYTNSGFAFTDTSFVLDHFTPLTYVDTGSTGQSIECDGKYIYYLRYNPNKVLVYDYDGNLITTILLNMSRAVIEPEDLSYDRKGGWWLISRNTATQGHRIDAIQLRDALEIDNIAAIARLAGKI